MDMLAKIKMNKIHGAFEAELTGKSGQKKGFLCIPLDEMFRGKNQDLLMTLLIKERNAVGTYGDTHFVKQVLEKAPYSTLTAEEKQNIPIIGSVEPNRFKSPLPAATEVETVVPEEVAGTATDGSSIAPPAENTDLPF